MSTSRTSPAPHDPAGLRSGAAVRLVAGRELRVRLRSKAFRATTAALVGAVVLLAVVVAFISARSSDPKVGVVRGQQALAAQVAAAAQSLGTAVEVHEVDESTGRAQVQSGELDAVVLGMDGTALQVVVQQDLDAQLRTVLTATASQSVLDTEIRGLGGDPATVAQQVAQARLDVASLEPAATFDPQRLAIGSIAGILVYLALMLAGQSIAQGVVEEKSSRVVELLLSTIRPWQLLAGKVLGIGLLALLQVVLVAGSGVVAGQLTGVLDISWVTLGSSLAWLVVWFVLGFVLYALVFAGLAALVSRQEDIGGVVTPPTMLLVIGYVIGISVLPGDPDNSFVAVLSLVPFLSPTIMPMRLAMGDVALWQSLLAVALALALIPLLVALAGRMYRNAVIRGGSRVGLREAVARSGGRR